ncbi:MULTISPECIES: hypothetical protein [Romboutsia]|uniref:Uncharacterized protein n=1 Tax=Romboutsia hominis TaxID=1507512 RepID=A0A2P2BX92_9FIRM|nr:MULTISPECIES: hypothetical protein [Romboutsia]MCH1961061.1 hypothetical protein [Romboutsia hominis]MCH1968510.1 hypothetical protein [Romboutsia hominis]MDB8789438.1 hypothetical protein [Romboutsia sp. 1001216sp1]MDB8792821.1 hypothetical protein [Romboutsia sp. 1001216sp1]MDB8795377.1 hypothetical protein [Romboutsia sp. 1001216sp1]
MLTSSIGYMILRTFPESLVTIFCGMLLMGIKLDNKEILKKGFLLGVIVIAIRSLPINFGVHTILSMIALGIMLYKMSNGDLLRTVISTCLFFIALAMSEGIYIFIATSLLNIPIEILTNQDGPISAIRTLPSLLIAIGIVFLLKKIVMENVNQYIKRG